MFSSYLEVIEGPKTGDKVRIREGVRIGRTIGEILLDDPKVSALHAQVEKDAKGSFVLVDRDSVNGIKINGHKVKRVSMLPGVRVQIGRSILKVTELYEETASIPPPIEVQGRHWKTVLTEEIRRQPAVPPHSRPVIEAFRPALVFDFVEGTQLETQVILGYGPRRFGSDVLDIEIHENLCPPIAFEVSPSPQGPRFQTQYPRLVLLNDFPATEAILKSGDLIRIGQTLLRVSEVT